MSAPFWRFRAMQTGEINVDPVQDEFFKAQDLVDALVRESIQNSLDARKGNSRIRVRFAFHTGPAAQTTEAALRYFDGLFSHLDAVRDEVATEMPARWDEPLSFLVIEDFGTRGLCGDPEEEPDLDLTHREKNDFFYFWRNVGRGVKSEKDRGRWGLGKAVFSVASRVRTVFGLTTRADDGRTLLLGQSVLRIHSLEGRKYSPYGFYGHFRGELPLPIEEPSLVENFQSDFRITRNGEFGLSLVIPWVRQSEIPVEELIRSLIRQYFYPILRTDLVVEIESRDVHETLSARTLQAVIGRYFEAASGDAAARLSQLTRWALSVDPVDYVELRPPDRGAAPRWTEDFVSPPQMQALRSRLESGQPVALRVPLAVKRKGRTTGSFFHVFMQRDDLLRRGEHHFIRRGITIPDIRSNRQKAVRALLVVDDDALSGLLGDSENPAHSDWSERADKVKTNYDHGPTTVRYVKHAIEYLAGILLQPPQAPIRDLLRDFFKISAPQTGRRTGLKKTPPTEPVPEIPAVPRGLRLQPSQGGFVISGDGGNGEPFRPASFRVEAAYRVRHGDPFRRYDPLDFVIGEGSVEIDRRSLEVSKIDGNRVEFRSTASDFRLHVDGFDPHRDLVIRIEEESEEESPDAP